MQLADDVMLQTSTLSLALSSLSPPASYKPADSGFVIQAFCYPPNFVAATFHFCRRIGLCLKRRSLYELGKGKVATRHRTTEHEGRARGEALCRLPA